MKVDGYCHDEDHPMTNNKRHAGPKYKMPSAIAEGVLFSYDIGTKTAPNYQPLSTLFQFECL